MSIETRDYGWEDDALYSRRIELLKNDPDAHFEKFDRKPFPTKSDKSTRGDK